MRSCSRTLGRVPWSWSSRMIFVRSLIELVSSGRAELKVIAVTTGAMCFAPLISIFTSCAVPSVFTTFR